MCTTGKMASCASLALDLLGLESFPYDESLSGWDETPPLTEEEK
jgi:3-mercaptopyruvate sulfurtransferase SseA